MEIIKVIIVDDHQIVIDGIKALLENNPGIEVIDEANNGKELFDKLTYMDAHVILLDIDMPLMNGYETAKELLIKKPDIKILALTMYNEIALIKKMQASGASGYVLKNIDKEELIKAITDIASGKNYFSSDITLTLLDEQGAEKPQRPGKQNIQVGLLTTRETEIVKCIAEGLSNKEIGKQLFISPRTVDTHRTNLMKKLNLHNVAGLIRFAIQNGLVE